MMDNNRTTLVYNFHDELGEQNDEHLEVWIDNDTTATEFLNQVRRFMLGIGYAPGSVQEAFEEIAAEYGEAKK
jgi:hypothetical protein